MDTTTLTLNTNALNALRTAYSLGPDEDLAREQARSSMLREALAISRSGADTISDASTPKEALERLEAAAPTLTARQVLIALTADPHHPWNRAALETAYDTAVNRTLDTIEPLADKHLATIVDAVTAMHAATGTPSPDGERALDAGVGDQWRAVKAARQPLSALLTSRVLGLTTWDLVCALIAVPEPPTRVVRLVEGLNGLTASGAPGMSSPDQSTAVNALHAWHRKWKAAPSAVDSVRPSAAGQVTGFTLELTLNGDEIAERATRLERWLTVNHAR